MKPAIALKNTIKKETLRLQEEERIGGLFPSFMSLFDSKKLSKILFLMNDYGVLGIIINEFKAIANRIQYDMYHIYTVGCLLMTLSFSMEGLNRAESRDSTVIFPDRHSLRSLMNFCNLYSG